MYACAHVGVWSVWPRQLLKVDDPSSISNASLVPTHRTYFLAHGFIESGEKPWLHVSTPTPDAPQCVALHSDRVAVAAPCPLRS